MLWDLLLAAWLASAPAKPPLQVTGCALLLHPYKFEGKVVQFIGRRVPAVDTLDYAPIGCSGKIGIGKLKVMRDHRLPLTGAHWSRGSFMWPATRIEGQVRIYRVPAQGRFEAMTFVSIEDAVIESAGYRKAEAAKRR